MAAQRGFVREDGRGQSRAGGVAGAISDSTPMCSDHSRWVSQGGGRLSGVVT